MAKTEGYRRFARVNGKLIPSPRFEKKSQADEWYSKMKLKNKFGKHGLTPNLRQADVPLFLDASAQWMLAREKEYGKNTTVSEDRNLRLHLLPVFGATPVNQITPKKIEKFLKSMSVTKPGPDGKPVRVRPSPATKQKIKALLSAFFESLLDDDASPIEFNPVKLVRKNKSGPRESTEAKLPSKILQDDDACMKFLNAAKTIGTRRFAGAAPQRLVVGRPFVYASLVLMTGPRASEVMALRWRDVDSKARTVTFRWVYERESKELKKRTKKGLNTERVVPLPNALAEILKWWRETTNYSAPDDFVLSKSGGGYMSWSSLRQMHDRICKYAEVEVSPHGLRHTFGRLFAKRTGNLKALQEILGHSSMSTTEIYSKLNAEHLQDFSEGMEIQSGSNDGLAVPEFGKGNGVQKKIK